MKTTAAISVLLLSLAGSAYAADLPTMKSAPPAPMLATVASDWTGAYVGVFGGYASGTADVTPDAFLTGIGSYPVTLDPRGGFVGADIGYNYQTSGGLVFGGVADWAWADLTGKTCVDVNGCSGAPDDSYGHGKVDWLATVRAKAGFAPTNALFVYATGGVAFAGTKAYDNNVTGPYGMTAEATHTGWTIGAGLDFKLTSSIFLEAEYLYADLGKQTYNYSIATGSGLAGQDLATDVDLKLNLFKAGVGVKF